MLPLNSLRMALKPSSSSVSEAASGAPPAAGAVSAGWSLPGWAAAAPILTGDLKVWAEAESFLRLEAGGNLRISISSFKSSL